MCQMCEEYEAELRRLGIVPEPRPAGDHIRSGEPPSGTPRKDQKAAEPARTNRNVTLAP